MTSKVGICFWVEVQKQRIRRAKKPTFESFGQRLKEPKATSLWPGARSHQLIVNQSHRHRRGPAARDRWLWDTGAQAKLRIFGTGVVFSYGRALRSGNNAFYLTLLR